ncbi:hypothetical protein CCACVL1_28896, partial [Corchorus capsularis]
DPENMVMLRGQKGPSKDEEKF